MGYSQNGWPVVDSTAIVDRAVLGVEFPNGWLKGDVDYLFTDLITRLNRIEPIHVGWCWGWYVKRIEGSTAYSNHSSGTAIDYNAPAHPMGVWGTYSVVKRTAIRELLRRYSGVIRWGGDYTTRPDDMHFEIVGSRTAVAAVAATLRAETPRRVEWMQFMVTMPALRQGDDDAALPGYDRIKRIQRQAGFTGDEVDGVWGPRTTSRLGYSVMTEDGWRKLFGLGDPG